MGNIIQIIEAICRMWAIFASNTLSVIIIVLGYLGYEAARIVKAQGDEIDKRVIIARWVVDFLGVVAAIASKVVINKGAFMLLAVIVLLRMQTKYVRENTRVVDAISGVLLYLAIICPIYISGTIFIARLLLVCWSFHNESLLSEFITEDEFKARGIIDFLEICIGTILQNICGAQLTVPFAIVFVVFNFVLPMINPILYDMLSNKLLEN